MYNQSDDDELLTVKDAVKFINEENGADLISEKTANKYRCVGGGPAFEYFGSRRKGRVEIEKSTSFGNS